MTATEAFLFVFAPGELIAGALMLPFVLYLLFETARAAEDILMFPGKDFTPARPRKAQTSLVWEPEDQEEEEDIPAYQAPQEQETDLCGDDNPEGWTIVSREKRKQLSEKIFNQKRGRNLDLEVQTPTRS